MLQLIYTSTALTPFTSPELSRLLLLARVNNQLAEITGMLVQRSNAFMQLLEGETAAVEQLFAKIANDPRHCAVQVLRRAQVETRTFPDWSLGFAQFPKGRAGEPVGLQQFFETKGQPFPGAGEAALQLLNEFRYANWRRIVDRGYAPVFAR